VTGASSGIGAEIARALARRGHGVTLVARREDRLTELAAQLADAHGVRAETLGCDLGDAGARTRMLASLAELGLEVDVLVNNAGFGTAGDFIRLDKERELEMVRVNVETVVALCGRFVPEMAGRGRGAVLNVASTAAFQPLPHNATYAATKAFVLSFTDALHAELRGTGVSATSVCPGPVKTEFVEIANMDRAAERAPSFVWTAPDSVAEEAVKGMEKGRRVVVPGKLNAAGALGGQHVPRSVLLRLADRIFPAS
jgi:short-subunit dehydrogenase